MTKSDGVRINMTKSDGVTIHHEKKSNRVRVDHEERQMG